MRANNGLDIGNSVYNPSSKDLTSGVLGSSTGDHDGNIDYSNNVFNSTANMLRATANTTGTSILAAHTADAPPAALADISPSLIILPATAIPIRSTAAVFPHSIIKTSVIWYPVGTYSSSSSPMSTMHRKK